MDPAYARELVDELRAAQVDVTAVSIPGWGTFPCWSVRQNCCGYYMSFGEGEDSRRQDSRHNGISQIGGNTDVMLGWVMGGRASSAEVETES